MFDPPLIPLVPVSVELGSAEFAAIACWPFSDAFVSRLLQTDIPQRVKFGNCRIWIYRDPEDRVVGFGTLDLCREYGELTNGQVHLVPTQQIDDIAMVPRPGYHVTKKSTTLVGFLHSLERRPNHERIQSLKK